MRSLASSLHVAAAGQPLPPLTPKLAQEGITLRRGQVSLIAGMPGSGKSMLALNYLMAQESLYALYFAADTGKEDMAVRVGARLLNTTMEAVEDLIASEGITDVQMAMESLDSRVNWVWHSTPSITDIDNEAAAFEQVWGDPPDVVVIENLSDVEDDSEDEWSGMKRVLKDMSTFARASGSAVIILHHTSEGVGSPDMPQPRKAVMGKVNRGPELVLTIALDAEKNELKVAAVKQRQGPARADGSKFSTLYVQPERMTVFDTSTDLYNAQKRSEWR